MLIGEASSSSTGAAGSTFSDYRGISMSEWIRLLTFLLLCLIVCTLVLLLQDGKVLHDPSSSAVALPGSVWTLREVAAGNSSSFLSPRPRIAYVFAGSPRSFFCPKVHWSIRDYLIRGLGGDPYVFVYVRRAMTIATPRPLRAATRRCPTHRKKLSA
jgi:hypothetical protein